MDIDAIKRQVNAFKALAADPAAHVPCPVCGDGEVRFQDSVGERVLSWTVCDFRSYARVSNA